MNTSQQSWIDHNFASAVLVCEQNSWIVKTLPWPHKYSYYMARTGWSHSKFAKGCQWYITLPHTDKSWVNPTENMSNLWMVHVHLAHYLLVQVLHEVLNNRLILRREVLDNPHDSVSIVRIIWTETTYHMCTVTLKRNGWRTFSPWKNFKLIFDTSENTVLWELEDCPPISWSTTCRATRDLHNVCGGILNNLNCELTSIRVRGGWGGGGGVGGGEKGGMVVERVGDGGGRGGEREGWGQRRER